MFLYRRAPARRLSPLASRTNIQHLKPNSNFAAGDGGGTQAEEENPRQRLLAGISLVCESSRDDGKGQKQISRYKASVPKRSIGMQKPQTQTAPVAKMGMDDISQNDSKAPRSPVKDGTNTGHPAAARTAQRPSSNLVNRNGDRDGLRSRVCEKKGSNLDKELQTSYHILASCFTPCPLKSPLVQVNLWRCWDANHFSVKQ
jgi:hypothetical protein